MIGRSIRTSCPAVGIEAYAKAFVDSLRAAWGLATTTHLTWLAPLSFGDVYKYIIDDVVRPTTFSYKNRAGATVVYSTFDALITAFQSDYDADGEVWFLYGLFPRLHILAQRLDSFLLEPSSFSDVEAVVDNSILSATGTLAETYASHIPWLSSLFGASLSTRWVSPATEILIDVESMRQEFASALGSKVGKVIRPTDVGADEFLDVVIHGLALRSIGGGVFDYAFTKARYKDKSSLISQDSFYSILNYFLSYSGSPAVALIGHVA